MQDEFDLSDSNVSFGEGDLGDPSTVGVCDGGAWMIGCPFPICGSGWCYTSCTCWSSFW